jgi:hypothetical protein
MRTARSASGTAWRNWPAFWSMVLQLFRHERRLAGVAAALPIERSAGQPPGTLPSARRDALAHQVGVGQDEKGLEPAAGGPLARVFQGPPPSRPRPPSARRPRGGLAMSASGHAAVGLVRFRVGPPRPRRGMAGARSASASVTLPWSSEAAALGAGRPRAQPDVRQAARGGEGAVHRGLPAVVLLVLGDSGRPA